MPQLRKRKSKGIIPEGVDGKGRAESPDVSSNFTKRKKRSETPPTSKTRETSRSKRRKKNDSAPCSDEESRSRSKKPVIENCSSSSKIGKNILPSVNVKNEPSDSGNLHDSVDSQVSSVTATNASEEEKKYEEAQASTSSVRDNNSKGESSSSEPEWEEVEDNCETKSLDDYKPDIPKEGVEITIDCPDLQIRKRNKKQFDENEWIRLHINRVRKDIQLSMHKTHLLCLLAHGMYMNETLNSDSVRALALSHIPSSILSLTSGKKIDKVDVSGIEKVVSWFCETFAYDEGKCLFVNLFSAMVENFELKKARNPSEYNLMFVVLARILGFKVRLCTSLYPITYKASNLIRKPNSKRNSKKSVGEKEKTIKSESSEKQKKVKLKESKVTKTCKEKVKKASKQQTAKMNVSGKSEKSSRPRRSTGKSYKLSSDEDENESNDKDFEIHDDNSSDDDFQKSRKLNSNRESSSKARNKKSNRKVLSSDSEPSSPPTSILESGSVLCWVEIFAKPEKQWIPIECSNNIINKPYDIEVLAPKPVSYILAYDNNSYVKDVTRRYCNEYMTATIKLRVDPDWWEESLEPFLPPNSQQDKVEEKKLDELLVNKPLPTTIQGFKNHPLYALKRHLLKFEAIYPPDAPPVGFMRGEPVYARDCVHQLHSRETWLKEARVVRIGEQPYKIVKARPKWDRVAGVMKTDLPLEIFGHWQTGPYEPPIAVDGKVPRNEYGNVELFKPCMLPRGTVHLQLPGLNRIAKKLGIDCSPAVVGFDGHKGSVHAVFDGFIVCEEFKDTLLAAWDEEQENARKREEEKREKRIYGNWKKLIKGLLIRERIKLKYNT